MPAIASPDLFQIIEAANFRTEQVHNHVAEIDQNPVSVWQAFDFRSLPRRLFDLLSQVIGNRAHMTGRPARSNYHDVRERRLFSKINEREVFGFVVFQRGDDNV